MKTKIITPPTPLSFRFPPQLRGTKGGVSAFTLVELIVVITILAILGTIAFLSLQGYSTSARNSTRTSDLSSLKSGLELYSLKVGGYPTPSNPVPITYSGGTVWYQGTIGDSVIKNLSSLNKKPVDPSIGNEYSYSLLNTRGEYQLGSIEEIGFGRDETELIPNSYASQNSALAIILGSYNGQILKVSTGGLDYLLAIPSIMSTDTTTTNLTTILTNKQLSYDGYGNLPGSYNGKGYIMTGSFNYGPTNPVIFSGLTSNLANSGTLQIALIDSLRNAYSGSQLTSDGNIGQLINTTNDADKKSLVSGMFSNKAGGLVGTVIVSTTPTTPTVTQWKDISGTSCTNDDITIGSQTWAGCNSVLGLGVTTPNSGVYNGTCYNYAGSTATCSNMNPTDKESIYNVSAGINNAGTQDNIWGKLYLWSDMTSQCKNPTGGNFAGSTNTANCPCPDGWHVPTDNEFEVLETTLNGGSNCRNATDGWLCTGLGWMNNTSRTPSNNMVKALKLPLAGSWYSATFGNRGVNTHLWSSTEATTTNARGRYLNYGGAEVYRNFWDKSTYGFSVRCIRD